MLVGSGTTESVASEEGKSVVGEMGILKLA